MDDMDNYDVFDSDIDGDDYDFDEDDSDEDVVDASLKLFLTNLLRAHRHTRNTLFNDYHVQKNSTNDNDSESDIFGDFIEHHLTPSKIEKKKKSRQYQLSKKWISDRQQLSQKSSHRIVVNNVHPNMDELSLNDHFKRFGFDVKSIDLLRRQVTKRFKLAHSLLMVFLAGQIAYSFRIISIS